MVVKGLWYNLDVWLWVIKWEHLCACVCVCVCMRACACECIFVCVCTKCKFYQGLLTIAVLHMGTRHYDNTDSNVALKQLNSWKLGVKTIALKGKNKKSKRKHFSPNPYSTDPCIFLDMHLCCMCGLIKMVAVSLFWKGGILQWIQLWVMLQCVTPDCHVTFVFKRLFS